MAPKRSGKARSSAGSKKKGKGRSDKSPAPSAKFDCPDDVSPLVLTSATQELFGCRADEDVTGDNPYKLLKKDDIVRDIKTRAVVSDFSPVKQIVLEYPEDEILLVFDRDFTYGQSFYLVLTPEAKDKILSPPEPDTKEEAENEVNKTPERKPWMSLGSEQEIEDESVRETREKLQMQFLISRLRRKFGEPACFSDRNAADHEDSLQGFPSYPDSRFSIPIMLKDCGTQGVPQLQSNSAQTEWKVKKNMCTQYKPRELSKEEKEKVLQSESLKDFCKTVVPRVLESLQQEEIMNVSVDDFKALGTGAETTDWSAKASETLLLHHTFADPEYAKAKKISCMNWHPTIQGVVAVALAQKYEERRKESTYTLRSAFIVLHSFSDPSKSQLLLECPDDIISFEFCPSDPNIIVGGCINGQVVLWDCSAHIKHLQVPQTHERKASISTNTFDLEDNKESKTPVVPYCAVSSIESSHKAPITDVQWLPPTFEVTRMGVPVQNRQNISVQVVTCSPDCTVLFWDVRLPKLLNQQLPDKKDNVELKTLMAPDSIPSTFKHLDRTWKPLFRVSLPKLDMSGEYAAMKFCLVNYTGPDSTAHCLNEDEGSEVTPDYSQLRAPSARTLTTLEDVNTKLYVGTEAGEIVYTDWKLVKEESGRLTSCKPLFSFRTHHWLVTTMQRSPFYKDIILTTGGWNFAIWMEDVMNGPIMASPNTEQRCCAGCWSPSRPAIFFIGKSDGSIEVWNLLENTREPTQVHAHITGAKITCIKPWIVSPKQHFLAVSDDLGVLRVLEIPKVLYTPRRKETLKVRKTLELEVARLMDYLGREERWAEERREAEQLKKKPEAEKTPKLLQGNDDSLKKEYDDYLKLEESVVKSLGLWSGTGNKQVN